MNKNRPNSVIGTLGNAILRGREYTVQATIHTAAPYILTGPKGAAWLAVRIGNGPDFRLVNTSGRELRIHGNAVRVTDADGTIRVAR